MPSKSAAQAKLMRAVAHNPAFAKKVGVPQSIGQEFMKADKRKMKKFELGGPTSYSGKDDSDQGMKMSTRRGGDAEKTFKQAFAAAKDGSIFEWKGKKYKKEYADKKPAAPAATPARRMSPEEFGGSKDEFDSSKLRTPRLASIDVGPRATAPAAAPAVAKSSAQKPFEGARQLRDFLRRDVEEKAERNRGLADRFGEFVRNTRMVGGAPDYMKDESGRIRIPSRDGEGMRRGGKIKKYAGGGSVSSASKRADGIAKKGKTRGKIC